MLCVSEMMPTDTQKCGTQSTHTFLLLQKIALNDSFGTWNMKVTVFGWLRMPGDFTLHDIMTNGWRIQVVLHSVLQLLILAFALLLILDVLMPNLNTSNDNSPKTNPYNMITKENPIVSSCQHTKHAILSNYHAFNESNVIINSNLILPREWQCVWRFWVLERIGKF